MAGVLHSAVIAVIVVVAVFRIIHVIGCVNSLCCLLNSNFKILPVFCLLTKCDLLIHSPVCGYSVMGYYK